MKLDKVLFTLAIASLFLLNGCAGGVYRERVYVGTGYYHRSPPPPPPPVYGQPAVMYPAPPPPATMIVVQSAPPPPVYGQPAYGYGYGHGHHHDHGRGKSTTVVNNTVVVAPTTNTTVKQAPRGPQRIPAQPAPGPHVYATPRRN